MARSASVAGVDGQITRQPTVSAPATPRPIEAAPSRRVEKRAAVETGQADDLPFDKPKASRHTKQQPAEDPYQKLIESRANQSGQSVVDHLNSTIRKEEFKIGTGEKEVLKKIVITGTPNEEAGQEGEFQYLIDMLNDDGYDIHLWFLSDFARGWMTKYLRYIRLNKPKVRQRPTPKHMIEITRRLTECLMVRELGEFDWITI